MISGIFVKLLRVDMAVRIGWDEYEVALLIDACNKIRDNKIDKTECVQQLSNLLIFNQFYRDYYLLHICKWNSKCCF